MFLRTNGRVPLLYNLQTLSGTSLVKVTQQANRPLCALELCGPHLATQVCSYPRCYTCVLVGSPKYVGWISRRYLTQSELCLKSHWRPASTPYSLSPLLFILCMCTENTPSSPHVRLSLWVNLGTVAESFALEQGSNGENSHVCLCKQA